STPSANSCNRLIYIYSLESLNNKDRFGIRLSEANHILPPALGLHLIEQGIRVKWMPATALVKHLQQAKKDLDLMTAMTKLDKYRVLIIDDIGYVKKTDSETQALFEFIAHRYESGSLIITSNQPSANGIKSFLTP
ncbi:IstB-like ATP binding protein, partial [Nitrosomonas nitrosa]